MTCRGLPAIKSSITKEQKKRGRRQTGTQNIYLALEIIAEHSNPEWLWLLLGTYIFLKKILIEVFNSVLPWKITT